MLTFDVWDFQNDVDLIHEIEATLGKQLEKFECKENEVLSDITMVRSPINIGFTRLVVVRNNRLQLFLIDKKH